MEVEDITLMHRITTKGDELMASRPGILNVKRKTETVHSGSMEKMCDKPYFLNKFDILYRWFYTFSFYVLVTSESEIP